MGLGGGRGRRGRESWEGGLRGKESVGREGRREGWEGGLGGEGGGKVGREEGGL